MLPLRFFDYKHLPEHLRGVSKVFHDAAIQISEDLKDSEEKSMALRKLLEAKDCAVRSKLIEVFDA